MFAIGHFFPCTISCQYLLTWESYCLQSLQSVFVKVSLAHGAIFFYKITRFRVFFNWIVTVGAACAIYGDRAQIPLISMANYGDRAPNFL
jgi:hypothetical protein